MIFRWRCNKVLPTVYGESLSYYEVICKLTKRVAELEKKVAPYVHNVTVESTSWKLCFQVLDSSEEAMSGDKLLEVMGEQGFGLTKWLMASGASSDGKTAVGVYSGLGNLYVKYGTGEGFDNELIETFTVSDVVV